jgi:hypothetical protein
LKPVFVDVDPETFNINPAEIKAKLTHRTRAIIPVHLFGLPANMSAIIDIAQRNNLQVIEDSCETMFADQQGKMVGSFGDLACFSTYVAHLVVGGVGGTASLGSGPTGIANQGGQGGGAQYTSVIGPNVFGGMGAGTPFGGGGSSSTGNAGASAISNTGAGGAGAGSASSATSLFSGTGGGAGGFVDAIISAPSATYAYAVGAAGTAGGAGTSGSAGGTGGSGYLIIEEHYVF